MPIGVSRTGCTQFISKQKFTVAIDYCSVITQGLARAKIWTLRF